MAEDNDDAAVEPSTDEPAAPDTPPTKEPASPKTPWSDDIARTFTDPELQQQVDGFLRETVQPYVTQLEQKSQPSRDAERLWNDFSQDPNNTFHAVAVELYGQEAADKLTAAISGEEDPEVTSDTPADDFKVDEDELPDNVREAVEFVQSERQQREWDAAFKDIAFDDEGNQIIDEELFYPFVTAADGDIDQAKDAYLAWQDSAKEKFGINVPNPDDVDTPPKTLDPNGGGATTAPPQQKEYKDIDEAIDDFFAEQSAPPTV
jgi:hypothetical protein